MRFGRTLVSFVGLAAMLLCAELWLVRGLAAQKSQIVFTHLVFDNFEIYVMDVDGGNRVNLSNHPVHDREPHWSPDGTKIAFVSDRNDDADQIYVMDSDGKNQTRLTDGPRRKLQPDWSPDSQKIAFTVWDGIPRIDVMDADGKNRTRLIGEASAPSWSPDGQQIMFVSARNWESELMVIGTDGQGLEGLKHPLRGGSPSYFPDGRRILYEVWEEGFHHINVAGLDGRNPKRITRNGEHHTDPALSPDGGAIAYVVSNDNFPLGAKIHLMTAEGKYIKPLSKVNAGTDYQPDFGPAGLAVSPASKKAAIWGRLKKRASNPR